MSYEIGDEKWSPIPSESYAQPAQSAGKAASGFRLWAIGVRHPPFFTIGWLSALFVQFRAVWSGSMVHYGAGLHGPQTTLDPTLAP